MDRTMGCNPATLATAVTKGEVDSTPKTWVAFFFLNYFINTLRVNK